MIDAQLLKCLECRLVGAPPKFDLPPPPPPPEFINSLLGISEKTDSFNMKQLYRKKMLARCLKIKNFISETTSSSVSSKLTKNSMPVNEEKVEQSESFIFQLNSAESLYLFFFICAILFLIVFIVALVFLFKLFRIRKDLHKSTSDSQFSKTMSSSLTNSTSAGSDTSSSNTINSQILSIKQETDSQSSQFYNQLFSQQRVCNQYLPAVPRVVSCDEYTEISSQYAPNYDSAYLEKLKLNCQSIAEDTLRTNQMRNSAYLVANNSTNALLMMNQLGQLNQNKGLVHQQQQNVQPNVYYVC